MQGPLVPIGAFKGTGLSIMTDILCGVLTGAAFGLTPYRDPSNHDVGHMLIAIDIERFLPYDDYLERIDRFCAELKASALAPGFDEILLPGRVGAPPRHRAPGHTASTLDRRDGRHPARPGGGAGCSVHPDAQTA